MNPRPTRGPRSPLARALGLGLILLTPLSLSVPAMADGEALTLAEAERLALREDPVVAASRARARAMEESAVADGQRPDPKLRTGLYNLPLDDLSLSSQPTTQWRIGVQQAFPRGESLKYREGRTRERAAAEEERARVAERTARRAVQENYLELFYQLEAERIVRENRGLFAALVDITQAHYGAGRSNQQDVLRAELELSQLDDRLNRIQNAADVSRAELSRWIGEAAWRPLSGGLPALPALPPEARLAAGLERHPEILRQSALIGAHRQAVGLAREQYRPGWSLGVEYRKRFGDNPDGSDRTDMAAVMLTVDLPLFTDKRQDRRLAASQQQEAAAELDREDRYRRLRRLLAREYANWRRLGERERRYTEALVKAAKENAEASLNAYQSGTTEFTTLMRARITELDVRLQALRVRVDRAKAQARLLYLSVEED